VEYVCSASNTCSLQVATLALDVMITLEILSIVVTDAGVYFCFILNGTIVTT